MSLDRALRLWLASPTKIYDYTKASGDPQTWFPVPTKDGPPRFTAPEGWVIESLDIKHEEGWSNDSGTSWPAEVDVIIKLVKENQKNGRGRRKTMTISAGDDPIAFMKELFELTEEN